MTRIKKKWFAIRISGRVFSCPINCSADRCKLKLYFPSITRNHFSFASTACFKNDFVSENTEFNHTTGNSEGRGAGMAQGWRRVGAGMAQGWRRDGAGMAQGWRRDGAGMAQGWRSGESTRLPPMWPGFDSRALAPYVG